MANIPSFPIAAGVATNAPHPAAAKVFLNWLLSKDGSSEVAKVGSYGTHPDAPPEQALGKSLPPSAQVWNIKLADWMQKRETYSKEWRDLFSGGK